MKKNKKTNIQFRYRCRDCGEDKIKRAFIEGRLFQCRKCVKEKYIIYKMLMDLDKSNNK